MVLNCASAASRKHAVVRLAVSGAFILCALAASAFLASCSKQDAGKQNGPKAIPVTVAEAQTRSVPVELNTFGTVAASSSVAVRAEVAGTLIAVRFQKGQSVKKGDVLFEIDPRSFQAARDQAEAAVARDKIQEANARKDAARQSDLLRKGIIPQTDYDKSLTDADVFAAAVKADGAVLNTANLQLDRCTIRSPIDGKAGDILVNEGNLVKVDDVPLVMINRISPIDVFFSIAQKDFPAVKQFMAQGKLAVKAAIPEDAGAPEVGELTFVDNAVDEASRTIKLGATFENQDQRLWPGLYVNVTVSLTVQNDAVVVPAKAVQSGRDGKFVFVVKSDNTVDIRSVTAGSPSGEDMVILKGIAVGERVVTDGQFQLTKESTITIKGESPQGKTAPEAGPAKDGSANPASGKRSNS